jgi:hypothetical protein
MTDLRDVHQQLDFAAGVLAQEIWDKRWGHVADLKSKPVGECREIISELERRCPGFTSEAYKLAISKGMFESR